MISSENQKRCMAANRTKNKQQTNHNVTFILESARIHLHQNRTRQGLLYYYYYSYDCYLFIAKLSESKRQIER